MRACVDWLIGTDAVSSSNEISHEATPARIAHFAIERKIGEGGMGVVYAAHDERLNRSVALKMISRARDETTRARFWREARAAAAINHPNVCQIKEGYFAAETLSSSGHFDPVRKSAAFQSLLVSAQRGRERALRVFRDAGGDHVLGVWHDARVEKARETYQREGDVC